MSDRISATGSVAAGSSATGETETASGFAHKEERAMQAQRLSGQGERIWRRPVNTCIGIAVFSSGSSPSHAMPPDNLTQNIRQVSWCACHAPN